MSCGGPREEKPRDGCRDAGNHLATVWDYDPEAILADPYSHPKHVAYALINIGIRDRGERWSKCCNCGEPYQLTAAWGDMTTCSESCSNGYADYIMSGEL